MPEPFTRKDPEKHRAQIRGANRAWRRAVKLLVEEHREEYDELHRLCCALEDPPVDPTGRGPEWEPIEDKVVRLRLDEVARVYRENITGNPVQAVREELEYETRNIAKRRVHWARKAGLLPPTTRGRKLA